MKRNDEWIAAFIGKMVAVLLVLAAFFGIGWLVWLLWTWTFPQIWPGGPVALINPGYWLFMAEWFLATVVFRMIFGRKR